MAYIGKEPGSGLRGRFVYTATTGQTSFTGADSLGRTLTYTDSEYTDVFLNGVKLDKTDYTATSGTSIVLDSGASANDTLEILAFDTFGLFSGEFAQDVSVGGDLTASDDIKMTSDSAQIAFGADSEVTLTHVADTGLTLKHTATADDKPINLTLATGETDMAANDVIGKISFQAPDEGTGTDAILVSGAVQARAEGDFSSSSNATSLDFMTGASEAAATKMTLTSAGALGIGTTSPVSELDVSGTTSPTITLTATSDSGFCDLNFADTSDADVGQIRYEHSSNYMAFNTGAAERVRIDGGDLLIGVTSAGSTGAYFSSASNSRNVLFLGTSTTSASIVEAFKNPNGTVGTIQTSASATSYNTSSDYRLKENVTGITDGITRVKQLNPSRFNFIVDADTKVDGFLAHEAQTVVPEAITGTKDETEVIGDIKDADGNVRKSKVVKPETLADGYTWTETGTQPVYQGIDQSKLVPVLTAALQEAIAKIETLETQNADFEKRLTALEG